MPIPNCNFDLRNPNYKEVSVILRIFFHYRASIVNPFPYRTPVPNSPTYRTSPPILFRSGKPVMIRSSSVVGWIPRGRSSYVPGFEIHVGKSAPVGLFSDAWSDRPCRGASCRRGHPSCRVPRLHSSCCLWWSCRRTAWSSWRYVRSGLSCLLPRGYQWGASVPAVCCWRHPAGENENRWSSWTTCCWSCETAASHWRHSS